MGDIMEMVKEIAAQPQLRNQLLYVAHSDCRTAKNNALWILNHLPESESDWIKSHRDELTDMLLAEDDVAAKRMLLGILKKLDYQPDEIRTDFLDFCMSKINSEHEPYAVRCFSIYCAFKMCRHYPELISELEEHLEMMTYQTLSPGLKSALRQTRKHIATLRRKSRK